MSFQQQQLDWRRKDEMGHKQINKLWWRFQLKMLQITTNKYTIQTHNIITYFCFLLFEGSDPLLGDNG
jgi:hypothetical protein